MARTIAAGMQTAVAAETSTSLHLIEINTSGGATRLATSPTDIAWDSKTWTAIGGLLTIGSVQETRDRKAQGVALTLSGVDQTIVALILSNHMRGRVAKVYLVHLSGGNIVADPLLKFTGYLNDKWTVREDRIGGQMEPGAVTVKTRIVSRLAALAKTNAVNANLQSHREMLRRGGFTGGDLSDEFFTLLPKLAGRMIYWGRPTPHRFGRGGGGVDPEIGVRDGDSFFP